MPWVIRDNCVYNQETGKKKGCSKNPKAYLRALYANVPEARRHAKSKKKG